MSESRTEGLVRLRLGTVEMADRPLLVRLPADLDKRVRKIPNYTSWLRDAIVEKLDRETVRDAQQIDPLEILTRLQARLGEQTTVSLADVQAILELLCK